MGKEKTTQVSQPAPTTVTPTATPQELELQKLQLEQARAAQPGLLDVQSKGLDLSSRLLGGEGLPGFLGQLPGGISSEAIGEQAAQFANKSAVGFQNVGLADSGVAFRETARGIGNELLFPAEQFNLQNLSQLLNLAIGGQAQVQAPIQGMTGQLATGLAGLRSMTQTGGGGTTTMTGMNPFMKSFSQSAGKLVGGGFGLPQAFGTESFWA